MLARVHAAVLDGIEARLVDVEVDLANGLPAFTIVGLPDASVNEARDRVRAAIHHAGQPFPMCRITVNLAPSDLPKHGPGLDLAVALGLLVAQEAAPQQGIDGVLVLGELGLGGAVRGVRGALAAAEAARRAGLRSVLCAQANAGEASLAGLPALPVADLAQALRAVRGERPEAVQSDVDALLAQGACSGPDLSLVRDQQAARRALEIAAAGGHNLLLSGPPGSGKTLLARALPGILPRLTPDEALEVTRIHSAAGLLPPGESLVRTRPFRAPHHGLSRAGLVGGGSAWIRPGEVSLSHRGVLFLDELPEFPRACLEALRQPLEDGIVTIVRARRAVTYPARLMLVAAMNPCPCGLRGSDQPCRCTPRAVDAYRSRLSGPLLDRVDLHVHVPRVDPDRLLEPADQEGSAPVRTRVERAREIGVERGRAWGGSSNADIPPGRLLPVCSLAPRAGSVLSAAARRHRLSARAIHRLLRVARTIADLAGAGQVAADHLLEGLGYRLTERREAEAS